MLWLGSVDMFDSELINTTELGILPQMETEADRGRQLRSLHRELTPEQVEAWHGDPPELVVLTTASLRKGYFVSLANKNLDFSQVPNFLPEGMEDVRQFSVKTHEPLEFQRLVEDKIHNGDGTLPPDKVLFLGYYYGVPLIVDPQTGETDGNDDPLTQSRNKIDSVQHQVRYQGIDATFVSSDTVGSVLQPDGTVFHLGKPRNHEQHPKKHLGEKSPEQLEEEEAFLAWYMLFHFTSFQVEQNFQVWFTNHNRSMGNVREAVAKMVAQAMSNGLWEVEPIEEKHINALVVRRGGAEKTVITTLSHQISPSRQAYTAVMAVNGGEIFPESAGGGKFQETLLGPDWPDPRDTFVVDPFMSDVLEQVDPELQPWLLMLHIMGAPVWAHSIVREITLE